MDVRVVEQRPNPLLKRIEVRFEVDHAGASTPRRAEVVGELAKQLKVPKERLVVEAMHARFGLAQSRGEALVYTNVESRDRVTREHILIRNGLKEKKVAGPAATEAPAAEAPAAAPKAEAPKSEPAEPKPEPKPEPKAEKKAEPKAEPMPEPKAEKKAEAKGEGKPAKAPKKEA